MNRLVLILGLLSFLPMTVSAQNMVQVSTDSAGESSVFVPIAKYLQRGDAECLAAWFAENLQVNVMGTVSNCSRSQARQSADDHAQNTSGKAEEQVGGLQTDHHALHQKLKCVHSLASLHEVTLGERDLQPDREDCVKGHG